ncbi:hypothetical protein LUZ60_003490 [Juncus effusus]|nr:hypothetical protein LUZ60_003490 [Juncus effusus]
MEFKVEFENKQDESKREEEEDQEVRLLVEDDEFASSSCQCRICHEEELQSSTSMESPCSCSGSLKFAHRYCIQRWCDEKGSTLCEICLQNFEPDYIVPPKKAHLVDVAVTIRGSLEVPRPNYEPRNELVELSNSDYAECSASSNRGATCCRSAAIILAVLLLLRHLTVVLSIGTDQYAFSLLIMFLLRASGILLPFFFVLRLISAIQHGQRQYQLEQQYLSSRREEPLIHDVERDEELSGPHIVIQISS